MKIEHLKTNHGGNLYQNEVKLIKSQYDTPKIIFDIGANVGGFTLELHKQFPNALIYAFEPVHETFEILKNNTKDIQNIFCMNFGFFNKDRNNVSVGMPEIPSHKTHNYGRMTVFHASESLDFVCLRNFGKWCTVNNIIPDMLKIDIEGCELPLIESANEYDLIKNFKLVYIEINLTYPSSKNVENILSKFMVIVSRGLNYLYVKK